ISRLSASHRKRRPIILAGSRISRRSTVLLRVRRRRNNWDGVRRRLRSSPISTSQATLKRTSQRLTREEQPNDQTDQSWWNLHVRKHDDDGESRGLWRHATSGSASVGTTA